MGQLMCQSWWCSWLRRCLSICVFVQIVRYIGLMLQEFNSVSRQKKEKNPALFAVISMQTIVIKMVTVVKVTSYAVITEN